MTILDIVIRITDRGVDAATSYFTFFFSLCLAIAVGLLIWINTPRGEKWLFLSIGVNYDVSGSLLQ